MVLRSLELVHFKNYREAFFEFSSSLNCISGPNGAGKTNILDAIHFLSLTKSGFQVPDSLCIFRNEDFSLIKGEFVRQGMTEPVWCTLQRGKRKIIKRDGKEYQRFSDHIGLYPVVMVSPYDIRLIIEGGEERRKFVNAVISQYDHSYLDALIQYDRLIVQRNAMLRARVADRELFEVVDLQLVPLAQQILSVRAGYMQSILPYFSQFYTEVSGTDEEVALQYSTEVDGDRFYDQLAAAFPRDIAVGHTTCGIHRDDVEMLLSGVGIRKIGSQGQQKTYLLALKLAQFRYMHERTGLKPLLLLDDVFDKLDESRVANLVRLVSGPGFGQIFITDTHPQRINDLLRVSSTDAHHFVIYDGVPQLAVR